MADASIDVRPLVRTMTIRIKGLKLLSLRLRMAAAIFTLGAWVAGIPLEMDCDHQT